MMSNNKILTVSYGTFSCTLEGFDDSFGTMKAIAEYFRDLASDDRYFGAEPPQPDADMLARIAQKEISRRVEAREHEGKIVLSAIEEPVPSASPALTAGTAAGFAATAAAAQQTAPAPTPEPAPVVEPEQEPTQEAAAEAGSSDAAALQTVEPAPEPADAQEHFAEADEDIYQEPELDPAYEAAQAERAALHDHDEDDNADEDITEATAPDVEAEDEPAPQETVAAEPEAEIAETTTEEAETAFDEEDANSALVAPITMLGKDRTEAEIEVDIVPGQPDAEVEAFFANSPSSADAYEETAVDTDNTPTPVAEPAAATDIADKLQRIRAVVAQNDPDEDVYLQERLAAEREEEAAAEAARSDSLVSDALRDITSALDADDEKDLAAAEAAELDEDPLAAPEEEFVPDVPKDHIAALLSRLDESRAEQAKTATDDTEEVAEELAEDLAEVEAVAEAEGEQEEVLAVEEPDMELSNLFDEDTSDTAADIEADIEADLAPEEEDDFDLSAAIGSLTSKSDTTEAEAEPEVEKVQAEEAPAPKARVIKVKRVDLAAAVAKGQLEEVVEPEEDTQSSSTLSAAEEDELARELAAVEAELAASNPEFDANPAQDDATSSFEDDIDDDVENDIEDEYTAGDYSNDVAAEAEVDHPDEEEPAATPALSELAKVAKTGARNDFPRLDEMNQTSDMNRLMAETESQMGEPEGATRRNAFAALRAAVAAKKADDAMGGSDAGQSEDDAYRTDLAEVVRPRRPSATPEPAQRTQRPGPKRNGPLKLVAEQRIDPEVEEAAPAPVRPRRVISRDLNAEAPEQSGFAAFVAEQGATKLPDILEAAASYLSFVEGRDQFSRPQLMSKVRELEPDEFTREEGLRSFGQLLRAGKIEKIKGGRFTVSSDIGYRPDDNRAVG